MAGKNLLELGSGLQQIKARRQNVSERLSTADQSKETQCEREVEHINEGMGRGWHTYDFALADFLGESVELGMVETVVQINIKTAMNLTDGRLCLLSKLASCQSHSTTNNNSTRFKRRI